MNEISSLQASSKEENHKSNGGFFKFFYGLFSPRSKCGEVARGELEDMIEDRSESGIAISDHERGLLGNILSLRDKTASDVMIPRVDIIAVDEDSDEESLIEVFTSCNHSRLPVYSGTLDDVIGMIHIKDLVMAQKSKGSVCLSSMIRRVLFVSPTMPMMDLLLEMRIARTHLACVVDEYGGIDGLITIEDLVEEIVGEIEDEHDSGITLELTRLPNGEILADARVPLENLEELLAISLLDEEEREEVDTIGGLVIGLVGRVPSRGELIVHPLGWEFEITEADPRRIRALKIRPTVAVEAINPKDEGHFEEK